MHTDPTTFYELLGGHEDLPAAVGDGGVRVSGDESKLAALLDAVPREEPVSGGRGRSTRA